jgi:hypothetical protein
MHSRYARFECRICGELIYSPILLEQESDTSFQEKELREAAKTEQSIELTCSGGHSDVYYLYEIEPPEAKPPAGVYLRRAMGAGG